MGSRAELKSIELWTLQLLWTAERWIDVDKIMAVFFVLRLHYPMPGLSFTIRNGIFWSTEVEEALKRLKSLGFIKEFKGAYRLGKKGYRIIKKILPSSGWALPSTYLVFYLAWDVKKLTQSGEIVNKA